MANGFIITGVASYRPFNARGIVAHVLTGGYRIFPSRRAAESYRDLSHWPAKAEFEAQIEEYK